MAAARRQAAGTSKSTAARASRTTRRQRLVESCGGGAAVARRALGSSVAAPLFVLVLVAVAMIALVAIVALLSAERTGASDAPAVTSAAPATCEGNLEAQSLALLAADCGTYEAIATAHARVLGRAPEQRVGVLAELAVAVPVASGGLSGALEPGFAHLWLALEHDVAAAAWSAAGELGRAAAATRLAAGEALQSEAYAAAACAG